MPGSMEGCKSQIARWVRANISSHGKVLDVGPGRGAYAKLLPEYAMDCIEIWEPYVERYKLRDFYHRVMVSDVRVCLPACGVYDLVIFGDVLEHLSIPDAQKILAVCPFMTDALVVSVPHMYEQGPWEGNPYETHLQPDLNHQVMQERYPALTFLCEEQGVSAWVWTWRKELRDVSRTDSQAGCLALCGR